MSDTSDCENKARTAAKKVSDRLDADVIIYGGDIESPSDYDLMEKIRTLRSRPNVLFLLTTFGGDAESAYRIARCLQRCYKHPGRVIIFVDWFCKSAGTLITIGMDEIVMSDIAELGPLDIQLSKPDELFERLSGLTPIQALTTLRTEAFKSFEKCFLELRSKSGYQITTKTASSLGLRLAVGLFKPIYAQVDPMRLGEIERAMGIAHQYGKRLNRGNLKSGTLERLISAYPSHEFIIDREEAEGLFNVVRAPTEEEAEFGDEVSDWILEALRTDRKCVRFYGGDEKNEKDIVGKTDKGGERNSGNEATAQRAGADRGAPIGDGKPESGGTNHPTEGKTDGQPASVP